MKIISVSRTINPNEKGSSSICWELAKKLSKIEKFEVLWIAGTSKKWDERKILNEKDGHHHLTIKYIPNKKDIFDFFTFLPKATIEINKILNTEKNVNVIIFPKEDILIAAALKSVEHKIKIIPWSYSEPFAEIIKKIDIEKGE